MLDNRDQKIKVERFKQTTGLCGPASLKILLSHFDKNYTEEQLAQLASSVAGLERGAGTEHEGLIKAAKAVGGYVFAKEGGTLEELEYFIKKEKLPVIIGWFDRDNDHYSVLVSITEKNIVIVDPAADDERWLERETFPQIWFDFIGPEDKIVSWGWYLVVTFDKQKFTVDGGQYY